jgi:hypothetical protein
VLTDTDPRAAAHVYLFAVLGTLPELVARVPAAAALVAGAPATSIAFAVRGGPHGALVLRDGVARMVPDRTAATIVLPFTSPAAFNAVIAGEAQPVPVSGFHRIGVLLHVFAPLTELLTRYLRPSAEDLADERFRATSTVLTLHVACAAVAQLSRHDRSGQFSAAQMPDGDVAVEVGDEIAWTLRCRDHALTFVPDRSPAPRAALTFSSVDVAGRVLSGEASTIALIGEGRMSMRGTLSMVDNVNRILDRASQYLS